MENKTGMFNVVVKREYQQGADTRTQWMTIGKAFANKKGGGFTILLNALPLPGPNGQVSLSMFPDTGRPERIQQNLPYPAGQSQGPSSEQGPLGDDPPTPTQAPPEQPETEDAPF
jgi:hypothetical protein